MGNRMTVGELRGGQKCWLYLGEKTKRPGNQTNSTRGILFAAFPPPSTPGQIYRYIGTTVAAQLSNRPKSMVGGPRNMRKWRQKSWKTDEVRHGGDWGGRACVTRSLCRRVSTSRRSAGRTSAPSHLRRLEEPRHRRHTPMRRSREPDQSLLANRGSPKVSNVEGGRWE